jgi:hypothetical protein
MATKNDAGGAGNQEQNAVNDQAKAEAEANQRAAEAAAANKAREDAAKLDAATAPYVVAPGGSISCMRGVVDAGQPVQEGDFVRGQKDLDDFVKRGVVLKRV